MKNIGVIGNGFVGSAVISGFSLHANIRIFDTKKELSTHSFDDVVNKSEFVFVCVPTPMKSVSGGEIVLDIMDSVFDRISMVSENRSTIFILKSTVVPGTVERYKRLFPSLKIVFNPEFLTERSARLDFINSARIVIGGDPQDTLLVEELYKTRFPYKKVIKTDETTAQFIKYMANCFFSVKVSFMNEMKQGADKLGVSWTDAMDGFISDGRIGNSHLAVPGHDGYQGFGGKCFPKDLNAFISMFLSIGICPTVMQAAWDKNLEVREFFDWSDIEGAVK